jgi:hypothetical protein
MRRQMLLALNAALPLIALPAFAQNGVPAYCDDLKQIHNHAMSRQRLAPIMGAPKEGNFRETTLPLAGWNDCSMYGQATYTCDSVELMSEAAALAEQARIAAGILACFADTWVPVPDQSSPGYLVLHPKLGPTSVTLSLDETEKGHVVRLTLFVRRASGGP